MTSTELFLKALNSYRTWCQTGMNFVLYGDLYEEWDKAIVAYAECVQISRGDAVTEIRVAVTSTDKKVW